ncbi:hypothetical protein Tco_1317506 [Tanacetum coccineum]
MSTPTQCCDMGSDSSLIPLSRGSFDVIVGMDWLSKRKFVIVCHEKVVRIPLEGNEILQVHGERTQGVICRRPPRRLVEFCIDLVHGATSVAKSPYRLAPLVMQELSEKLREYFESCKTRVSYDLVIFRGDAPVSFVKKRSMGFI